jgi:hypothetical protein
MVKTKEMKLECIFCGSSNFQIPHKDYVPKEFDYKISSNGNLEIVMKVSIKNVKKILEKVYAYNY